MTDSELNTLLVPLPPRPRHEDPLSMASFRLFFVSKPECVPVVDISTEVTEEDLVEAIEDEYGVKYSKDRKKRLLKKLPKILKANIVFEKVQYASVMMLFTIVQALQAS